jgi:hypothetical protein
MTRNIEADAVVSTQSSGNFAAVTKSDTTILPHTRGLYVGVIGDVAVRGALDGDTVTFVGVPAGTTLPIRVDQVLSTGTTAASIVALF